MFYFDELDLTVKRGEEITGTIAMKPNKKNNVSIVLKYCIFLPVTLFPNFFHPIFRIPDNPVNVHAFCRLLIKKSTFSKNSFVLVNCLIKLAQEKSVVR